MTDSPLTVCITGSTDGIGLSAARALAADGHRVVVHARTAARGADVAAALDAWVQRRVGGTVFAGGCRSWYLTASGRNTTNWPASTLTFRRRLRRLDLADFQPAPVPGGAPVAQV